MTYRSFKVATREKKSIVVTETFEKTIDGILYRVDMENTWRWGSAIVSGDDLTEDDLRQENGLEITGWEVDDQQYDDGVAMWFHHSDNTTEQMKEDFERLWDEDGYSGVEEDGWDLVDVETWFYGPLDIELIEEVETDEEEESDEKPSSAWPFS